MYEVNYGGDKFFIEDENQVAALMERAEQAANGGKASWVEIGGEGNGVRLLVQAGVPCSIVLPANVQVF